MTRNDDPFDRLTAIAHLIADALALADEGSELLLGAKLSDAQACVDSRLEMLAGGRRLGCGRS